MTRSIPAALLATALFAPVTAQAAEATLQIELGTKGDFERRVMTYDCNDGSSLPVTYINAAPNFLALLSVTDEPEPLVFSSVVAASGVRYVSGIWVWWTKGVDASLYDATLGEDAEAVLTCSELNNTP
ncbi:MliC family protein [Devosia ginsengisoli]|uniref:MliC family protein n=1 Tax=Devosia ginsengisoli TaxID=400770 RepID=UPI0026EC0F45|nr:MliC family protein [Devosia ginsengisoli]MCR6673972.1 MliC family protein [Devosia ginsengisoli]